MSDGPIAPDMVSTAPAGTQGLDLENYDASPTIHRSASHTQLVGETASDDTPTRTSSIHRSFSENILAHTPGNVSRNKSIKQESEGDVKTRRSLRRLGSIKRRSTHRESEPHYTITKFIVGADQSAEEVTYESSNHKDGHTPDRELKTRSVSGSLSKFARKSWASTSRSPSPSPSKRRPPREAAVAPERLANHAGPAERRQNATNGIAKSPVNGLLRRNSFLGKKTRRPLSSLMSDGQDGQHTPSVPPIPKSFSTDKLHSLDQQYSSLSNPPALPKSKSYDRVQGMGIETQRKKDELWSVFRNLDGEYQKFQSRPGSLRTVMIRSALLPFLRTYADHSSISSLRPEDLDRRSVILNKWWTGLLEMLNGRHGESVSGNDRPAVLEAVTALMVRPEWTLPPLTSGNRPSRTPRASLKSRSTTSLGSTMTMSSDFLAESVYHNVRNTFTQNLLAQMAYVVDKMSMRSVAASVVTFCGKATAYAFFYCDGVAEILVRLWATPPGTLKRILSENSLEPDAKLDSIADRICTTFPSCLHSLTFKSLRPMLIYLRSRPHLPIATAYIPWHGPWTGRWAGKDTDLFYVFTKFYIDLACRFLPEDSSMEERVASPGWLLVQAQILSVLDATMQRVNNQPPIEQVGPSVTFDEMLGEADANATVLPHPAHGGVRSMAENRLILLLRDCLSGSGIMTERAQSVFADSFSSVLKAAARKTSVFDHNACFALCDLLEEAFAILTRYQQGLGATTALIDWTFWLDVCKHMLQSQNSMTEVRLFSFLYVMWPTITSDVSRKREVCVDWLLTEKIFQEQFNHWCPMVRAFYMRLLIWRVARVDGGSPGLDRSVLAVLMLRLQESWGHFLYIQEQSGKTLYATPSTPAPGRQLLIMRNDVQPAPAGMFLSFDGILSSYSATKVNPYERHSSLDSFSRHSIYQPAKSAEGRTLDGGRKKWSIFKSIMPASSLPRDRPRPNQHDILGNLKPRVQAPLVASKAPVEKRMGPNPPYMSLSFKFSLEWIDRDSASKGAARLLHPPKLPPLAHMAQESHQMKGPDGSPLKPKGAATGPSKYAGKALAEWALLVIECKNFFERRKAEGVPKFHMVETPTLGVEPFRKL